MRHFRLFCWRTTYCLVLLGASFLTNTGATEASSPPKPKKVPTFSAQMQNPSNSLERRIFFVPLAQWNHIVRQHPQGATIPYETLLRRWNQRQQSPRPLPQRLPHRVLLQSLQGMGELENNQMQVKLTLRAQHLRKGWSLYPLPLRGIRLSQVKSQGVPGGLVFFRGRYWLALQGRGRCEIKLQGTVQPKKHKRGHTVQFRLPKSPSIAFHIRLAGHQEILQNTNQFHAQRLTKSTVLLGGKRLHDIRFTYRPWEATTQQTSRYTVQSDVRYWLGPHQQRLRASFQVQLVQGHPTQFVLQIPPGFLPIQVQAPELKEFRFLAKKHQLWLRLSRNTQRKKFRLRARFFRTNKQQTFRLVPIPVRGAYEQTGTFRVWHAPLYQARLQSHASVRQIKKSMPTWNNGIPLFSFAYWSPRSFLQLRLLSLPPNLHVFHKHQLKLRRREAKLTAQVSLTLRAGELYQLQMNATKGWRLLHIEEEKRENLPENKTKKKPTRGSLRYWQNKQTIHVLLKKKVLAHQTLHLRLEFGKRLTFPKQGHLRFSLPTLHLLHAQRQTGQLNISPPLYHDFKELESRGIERQHQKGWSYRILQTPYQGTFRMERKASAVSLVTVSRYTLEQSVLRTQVDLHYRITGAGVRQVRIFVPKILGQRVQFTGQHCRLLEQRIITSKTHQNQWQLQFAQEQFGRFSVSLRFQQRISSQTTEFSLPMVSGVSPNFETGFLAVETTGNTELTAHAKELQEVDSSEVPAPLGQRPPQKTIFSYRYFRTNRALSLRFHRYPQQDVLKAVIHQLHMTVEASQHGRLRLTAQFQLVDASIPYFEAILPKGSTFWGAQVNGQGVKPFQTDNHLKLSLPPQTRNKPRKIRILYEIKQPTLDKQRSVTAQAPKVNYPIYQTHWSFYLPKDYWVTGATSRHPIRPSHSIQKSFLAELVRELLRNPVLFFFCLLFVLALIFRRFFSRIFLRILRFFFGSKERAIGSSITFLLLFLGVVIFISTSLRYSNLADLRVAEKALSPDRFSRFVVKKPSPKKKSKPRFQPKSDSVGKEKARPQNTPSAVNDNIIALPKKKALKKPPPPPPAPAPKIEQKPTAAGAGGQPRTFDDDSKTRRNKKAAQKKREQQNQILLDRKKSPDRPTKLKELRRSGLLSSLSGKKITRPMSQQTLTPTTTSQPTQKHFTRWLEGRFIQGVRSLALQTPSSGQQWTSQGLGSNDEMTLYVAPQKRFRFWLVIALLFGGLLYLLLAWWCSSRRTFLFLFGFAIIGFCSVAIPPHRILMTNAFLLGWCLAGVFVFFFYQTRNTALSMLLCLLPLSMSSSVEARPITPLQRQKSRMSRQTSPTFPQHKSLSFYAPYQPSQGIPKLQPHTRILVPRSWQQRSLETQGSRLSPAKAPLHYVLEEAFYRGKHSAPFFEFQAQIRVRVLRKGPQRILLRLPQVRMKQALVNGTPTALFISQKGYALLVPDQGSHQIQLQFQIPARAKRTSLQLQLPRATAGRFQFQVPGSSWVFEQPKTKTLLPSRPLGNFSQVQIAIGSLSHIQLTWQPKVPQARGEEALSVKAQTRIQLQSHLIRLFSTYHYKKDRGNIERLSWRLPPKLIIERVQGPKIRRWWIVREKQQRFLLVRLETPQKEYQLSIQSMRPRPERTSFQMPRLYPLGVVRQTGHIGIHIPDNLRLNETRVLGAEAQKVNALPKIHKVPSFPIHRVYSYTVAPSLFFSLREAPTQGSVQVMHHMHVRSQTLQMKSQLNYQFQAQPPFVLRLQISPQLRIHRLTSDQGRIREYWIDSKQNPPQLHIALRSPMKRIRLHIESESTKAKTLPLLLPQKLNQIKGRIAIHTEKQFRTTLLQRQGLDAISLRSLPSFLRSAPNLQTKLALAYQFHQVPYQGKLKLQKSQVEQNCTSTIHASIGGHSVRIRGLFRFQATTPGSRVFRLSVPTPFAERIQIRHSHLQSMQRQANKQGRTTLILKTRQLERHLLVSFRFRFRIEHNSPIDFPKISPEGTERTTQYLTFGKLSQVRVPLQKAKLSHLRKISPQLVSLLPPGTQKRRLFAAYQVQNPMWSMRFSREELKTDAGIKPIIDIAHLETVYARNGRSWTRATYTIRSPGLQFLRLSLPTKAKLWSVHVNKQAIQPSYQNESPQPENPTLLIPLPPRHASDLAYNVQLIYTTLSPPLSTLSERAPTAPLILQTNVSESFWTIYLPRSFRPFWLKGNMEGSAPSVLVSTRLENALDNYQRIATISSRGNANEYRRIQGNMVRQLSKVYRYYNQANTAQQSDENNSSNRWMQQQRGKISQNRSRLWSLSQTVKGIQQGQIKKTAETLPYGGVVQRILGKRRPLRYAKRTESRDQHSVQIPWIRQGQPMYFRLIGGRPDIRFRIYHDDTVVELVRWSILGLLLIFGWMSWRKRWFISND